jgi:hypothetical protein
MNKRTARDSSSISRVKFRARTSFANAARQQNFQARKKKFVDDLPQVHYPHTKQRVMAFINHSQKFPATRFCGLKGGIING